MNRKKLANNRERIARQTGAPSAPAAARAPKGYCFSFVKNGTCNKGDSCKFKQAKRYPRSEVASQVKARPKEVDHVLKVVLVATKSTRYVNSSTQGRCDRGENCRFLHKGKPPGQPRQTLNLGDARGISADIRRERRK